MVVVCVLLLSSLVRTTSFSTSVVLKDTGESVPLIRLDDNHIIQVTNTSEQHFAVSWEDIDPHSPYHIYALTYDFDSLHTKLHLVGRTGGQKPHLKSSVSSVAKMDGDRRFLLLKGDDGELERYLSPATDGKHYLIVAVSFERESPSVLGTKKFSAAVQASVVFKHAQIPRDTIVHLLQAFVGGLVMIGGLTKVIGWSHIVSTFYD